MFIILACLKGTKNRTPCKQVNSWGPCIMMPCLWVSFLTYKLPPPPPRLLPDVLGGLFIVLQPFDIIFQRENQQQGTRARGRTRAIYSAAATGNGPRSPRRSSRVCHRDRRPGDNTARHQRRGRERERLLVSSRRIFHMHPFFCSWLPSWKWQIRTAGSSSSPLIPLRLRADHLICEVRCLRKTPRAAWEAA